MKLRLLFVLPLVGFALSASARDTTEPAKDRGVAADPYKADSRLTTGRMEGFRRLWVDPDAFATALVPVAPIAVTPVPPPVPPPAAPTPDASGTIAEATPEPPPARPTAPSIPARGDLPVRNHTSSWAELEINGQKAARIGPFDEAWVRDVKSGVYELDYTLANGMRITERVNTLAPSAK